MKKTILLISFVAFIFSADAQVRYLKGILNAAQQVPANASAASGVVIVKLNTSTNFVEVFGDYADLGTAITASHIHQAPVGSNGGVFVTLAYTGGTTGALSGSATITGAQTADMLAGNSYINVHSNNFPGGEIRAQLSPATDMQTLFFNARIQGAQQVPPNSSTATGWANVLLDKTKDSVFVTGNFSGLSVNATAAHIHGASPGINGGVYVPLFNSAAVAGAIHVASPLSATAKSDMIDGDTYINIHTSANPGGEIRGQINQFSQLRFFKGVFQGSQEVPPSGSAATGSMLAVYYPDDKLLNVAGDYQNLTTAVTAAHVHSPALPGTNAGVLFALTNTGGTTGSVSGSKVLTPAEEADLYSGKMYANVHTSTFTGGEIRAQLTGSSVGESQILIGYIQGSQQVPANGSTATGYVEVILDRITNEVFLSGFFSGLTATASAAHIHQGAVGVNGPVVVTLNVNSASTGSINGSATVSQAVAAAMIAGNTYVNIHNASFPGGEIRGQLGNFTLPVVLTYFKGYKEGNGVKLIWKVAQEVNFSHYEIEQQNTDNGKWIRKLSVPARGESGAVGYEQSDYPLIFDGQDVLYRLKMIDKDGKFSYSNVVKVSFKITTRSLVLLGNPVKDELRFVVTGVSSAEKAEVKVVDINGRILRSSRVTPGMIESISVGELSSGVYKIVVNLDGKRLTQTFIK